MSIELNAAHSEVAKEKKFPSKENASEIKGKKAYENFIKPYFLLADSQKTKEQQQKVKKGVEGALTNYTFKESLLKVILEIPDDKEFSKVAEELTLLKEGGVLHNLLPLSPSRQLSLSGEPVYIYDALQIGFGPCKRSFTLLEGITKRYYILQPDMQQERELVKKHLNKLLQMSKEEYENLKNFWPFDQKTLYQLIIKNFSTDAWKREIKKGLADQSKGFYHFFPPSSAPAPTQSTSLLSAFFSSSPPPDYRTQLQIWAAPKKKEEKPDKENKNQRGSTALARGK